MNVNFIFMKKERKQNIDNIAGKFIAYLKQCDHAKRKDEGEVWQRITDEIVKEERRIRLQKRMRQAYITLSIAAACALFLLYIGKGNILTDRDSELEEYVNQLSEVLESNNQVQLLLSNDKTVHIDKDTVGIVYTPEGNIRINKDVAEVGKVETGKDGSEKDNFNQIIVPKGKYTQLTLADGTRMHVNSGTRVVYPRVFGDRHREIYVEGEVFLDVTPDKKRPFHVKTSQFEVEVLGTSFNVNSYKQRTEGEVVLVEGSVKLFDKHNNQVLLKPDNLITVRDGQAGKVKQVNARDYTAWINGLLILHDEPLMKVFEKLERFYAVSIVIDPSIQTEIVDGKLDLRLSLPELIRMISVVVPIDYQSNNGTYYINSIKK